MILLLVGVMHLSASTYSQTKVSLNMKDVTMQEVFSNLEKMTNYTFLYKRDLVGKCGKVNVEAVDKDFSQLLKELLNPLGLSFTIDDKVVIITNARTNDEKKKNITIRGRVMMSDSTGVPGATVILKGTSTGVSTNMAGEFILTIPYTESPVLVFSFVGMKTREVVYRGQKEMAVLLHEDVQAMDEVVVTGYQSINRRDMVGAYTTVKAEDIMMPAYNSIDQMLQGQVAGLMVVNSSSRVGTSPKIKLRGTSTLLGNQAPLWVVDGIIQEDPIELNTATYMTQDLKDIIGSQISWLNPMDIETITVLKDASATAIYGSKASNGVIVITTKKGKADRLTISYSGNISINTKPNYGMFNLMNSKERVQFSQEAFNAGAYYFIEPIKQYNTYEGVMQMFLAGDISRDEYTQRKKYLETVNTDWLDLLTQSAVSHNHNLSVSGGTEKITYRASVGYSNNLGQEIGNESEKMTGHLSADIRLHPKVRLNVNMNGNSETNKAFGEGVNPLSYATTTSRAIPAFDENGDRLFYQNRATYLYNSNVKSLSYNFMNERDNSGSEVEKSYFSAALNFTWDILDWLKYEFTGGYTRSNLSSESWKLEKTFNVAREYRGYDYNSVDPGSPEFKAALMPFGGVLFTSDALQVSYNVQNKLLISKAFDESNRLNVMLAMEVRSSRNKENSYINYGYIPERGEVFVTPTKPEDFQSLSSTTYSGWGILQEIYDKGLKRVKKTDNFLSFFATLAYSLKNRYVFNFSIRNDASNRFGQDANKRFDPTYSFGLAWRVMDEPFLQDRLTWLSMLNLKATYGIQGNALTRLGPDLLLRQQGVAKLYNQYQTSIASIPNPNLSWERTKTWNASVDLELFKAISLVFDYYWKSSNAIVSQTLPFEYGVKSIQMNGGRIRNSGVEFTVSFTPIRQKDWGVSVSLNSSKNWNKAGKEIYQAKKGEFLNGSSDVILKKGYPIGGFWSYSFAGLSPEDGHPLFNLLDVPEEERDRNIDPTTFLVYSGEHEPAFTGGMNLSIRYKSLALNSSFALLLGNKKRLQSPFANFGNGGTAIPEEFYNLDKDLTKRWKKPGDEKITDIPGFITTGNYSIVMPDQSAVSMVEVWAQSDVRVVDASFFRCRQLSLSWTMNPELCKKVGVKSLSLNANVNNLFVIASKKFNGFDPELDNSVMPKTYSFGVNVGF